MLWETQTLKDVFPFQMLWENVGIPQEQQPLHLVVTQPPLLRATIIIKI
jgi:hypothetical protein